MWFSARELAAIPGMPGDRNNVRKRAEREGWQRRERVGKGGGWEYHVSSLPEETQAALGYSADPDPEPEPVDPVEAVVADAPEAEERDPEPRVELPKGMDPLALIEADWNNFLATSGQTKSISFVKYVEEYNAGSRPVSGILKRADGRVRTISVGWLREKDNRGFCLGKPQRGRFQRIEGDPRLKSLVLSWLKGHLKPNLVVLHEIIEGQYEDPPSRSLLYSYCQSLERDPYWRRVLAEARNPDGARGRYGVAAGTQHNESAPNDCWEWDGTPVDVWLPEHGRYSLLNVVDKYTRRLKTLVWPTVSSEGYGILAYRLLEDWGLPQRVVSDCGSAEKSAVIRALWQGLGVSYIQLPPYSPEKKGTIERHNRTINDWLRLHPNFKGSNVAEAQALRGQKSFAQRRGETLLTVACGPEDLQAWIDGMTAAYHLEVHGGLKGRSPQAVLDQALAEGWRPTRVQDLSAVRLLLEPVGIRTVSKGRIRIDGGVYIAPELGDIRWSEARVECRRDPVDLGRIFVFAEGAFICIAQDAERLGADRRVIAVAAKQVEKATKKQARQKLKEAEKLAGGDSRRLVEGYVESKLARGSGVVSMPVAGDVVAPAAVVEAGRALAASVASVPVRDDAAKLAAFEAERLAEELAKKEDPSRWHVTGRVALAHWEELQNQGFKNLSDREKAWVKKFIERGDGKMLELEMPVAL